MKTALTLTFSLEEEMLDLLPSPQKGEGPGVRAIYD
jgi:hypothetical protein